MDLALAAPLTGRSTDQKLADIAALRATVQAAINVELFTIPLYMCAMYSIQGTHQITGDNDFYQGRLWPGCTSSPNPTTDNQVVFNLLFKVFVEEMFHLQLAGNMASAVGATPSFTSPALMDPKYGWTCYGPGITTIPHILDLQDLEPDPVRNYSTLKVNLGPINSTQVLLFLAIEETDDMARARIKEEARSKYFPDVPYPRWTKKKTESDLPMFGSIGWMYRCLWQYLRLGYDDGTTLWGTVFPRSIGRDVFNQGRPKPEYPRAIGALTGPNPEAALIDIYRMIDAITDQGEGRGVGGMIRQQLLEQGLLGDADSGELLQAVRERYQVSYESLVADYSAYDDTGAPVSPSGDAVARGAPPNVSMDHYEVFSRMQEILQGGKVETWDQWHAAGNVWTADDLKAASYDQNKHPLPKAEEIAAALNDLKTEDGPARINYTLLSQASTGAIAGVTRVLNQYWTSSNVSFPYPSMAGSGDRMSICWAVFGEAPDLSLGIGERDACTLNHACQGLDLSRAEGSICANVAIFHTCRGSNQCRAEGGCGYVQNLEGTGGGCNSKVSLPPSGLTVGGVGGLCGAPSLAPFSAPADNKCGGLGGCAVPISGSQLYPEPPNGMPTRMQLFDYVNQKSVAIGTLEYSVGEPVYQVAWNAYRAVLAHRGQRSPDSPPPPSKIRLAFPPST